MIPKVTIVAALVLLGFLSVAEAQGVKGGQASTPSSGASASVQASIAAGWTFFHIAHCFVFNDFFFFFPLEAIGVSSFFTNDLLVIPAITPACQTGNLVAVFIVDPSTITWNQFYTYTFK
jgi:hypothetical protein